MLARLNQHRLHAPYGGRFGIELIFRGRALPPLPKAKGRSCIWLSRLAASLARTCSRASLMTRYLPQALENFLSLRRTRIYREPTLFFRNTYPTKYYQTFVGMYSSVWDRQLKIRGHRFACRPASVEQDACVDDTMAFSSEHLLNLQVRNRAAGRGRPANQSKSCRHRCPRVLAILCFRHQGQEARSLPAELASNLAEQVVGQLEPRYGIKKVPRRRLHPPHH